MIYTAGGTFDPKADLCYFIASNPGHHRDGAKLHDHILVAVNELRGQASLDIVESWLDAGARLFIDSGIYNLTMEHSRKHGVSMDVALSLAPDEIDGFDALLDRYLNIIDKYGKYAWGYIELDQGGRSNKIATRARLEGLGLRPVPVYHPLVDGWDYFDYLAERYDRICLGNIVHAEVPTRRAILATIWERHQAYPNLWIHVLGMTPHPHLNAYPFNSCDTSAWLASLRWHVGYTENANNQTFGGLPPGFRYVLGSDPKSDRGAGKAVSMSAYGVRMQQRNWRNHVEAWEKLGCRIY